MRVATGTEYFGFVLGPTRGRKSWSKPLQKMLDRARARGRVGGGMQVSFLAARMFITSTASFVAQLLPPPPGWEITDRQITTLLFPGPREWSSPAILGGPSRFGMVRGLDLAQLPLAARARVYRYEARKEGDCR